MRQLALLDERAVNVAEKRDLSFEPPPFRRRFWCGVAQAAALPVLLSLTTAQWLGVFVSYMVLTGAEASLLQEIASLLGVYACINVATVAIAIAMKWILLGRIKPGRYPLWGVYYYRWWLANRFLGLTHMKWFQASSIMRLYLQALGAKVGEGAIISSCEGRSRGLGCVRRGQCLRRQVTAR